MLELGMVQQNEYDEAVKKVEDGLPFQKAENLGSIYSYHTDATISQVIEDVAKEKGISKSLASTMFTVVDLQFTQHKIQHFNLKWMKLW